MNAAKTVPRFERIIRGITHIWSILVTVGALLIFLSPESGGSEPIAAVDIFLLSLTGVALLGLLIAWVVLKGDWLVGFLILDPLGRHGAASGPVPDRREPGEKDEEVVAVMRSGPLKTLLCGIFQGCPAA
jgi:hypothetical protein